MFVWGECQCSLSPYFLFSMFYGMVYLLSERAVALSMYM